MTRVLVGEDYTHATSFSLNFRYQNHNDNLKQIIHWCSVFEPKEKDFFLNFYYYYFKKMLKDKDNFIDPDTERKENFINSNETSFSFILLTFTCTYISVIMQSLC